MDRKTFLQSLLFMPVLGSAMKLNELEKLTSELENTERMPVLFIGHGNPMYAITDNPYRSSWMELGKKLSPPKAILCISAHWLTRGTSVTMTDKPKTIHDFGGFPDELFKVQYPAPGAVDFAKMAIQEVSSVKVQEDFEWGLDHGAWSVLRNMYPEANVPVFQMSLDYTKPAAYHFELAKELSKLRNKGVLIVASGNVVHNLGAIKWGEKNPAPYDWAIEFDTMVKKSVEDNNFKSLVDYQKMGNVANMAHPSNDHYLPLLYAMGVRDPKEKFSFFNDTFDMGSMSMRSVIFG